MLTEQDRQEVQHMITAALERPRAKPDSSQAQPMEPLLLTLQDPEGQIQVAEIHGTWPHIGTGASKFALCTFGNQTFRLYEKTAARLAQGETVRLRIGSITFDAREGHHAG